MFAPIQHEDPAVEAAANHVLATVNSAGLTFAQILQLIVSLGQQILPIILPLLTPKTPTPPAS